MKRSHVVDPTSSNEEKARKVRMISSPVVIKLDQSIGSNLLYRKFKYQTSELQLFLQHVPILFWHPIDVIGRRILNIDSCIFSAVVRNSFHMFSTNEILCKLVNCDDEDRLLERIYHSKIHKNLGNSNLDYLLKSLLDDELFLLQTTSSHVLKYASDRLKNNEEFISKVTKQHSGSSCQTIYSLDESDSNIEFNETSEIDEVIEAVRNGKSLCGLADKFKDMENIVLEATSNNVEALKYASNRLKDNEEFMLKAVKCNANALELCSNRLKDDEHFILQAIKYNGGILKWASPRLKDNEEFMLEASIKCDPNALELGSNRLKDDEHFILQAVKNNGGLLKWASPRLKDNEVIVREAVKQSGYALQWISERLKDNEQIMLLAAKNFPYDVLYNASDRLKDDEQFVLELIAMSLELFKKGGSSLIRYSSNRLKDNEEFMLEAVKCNADALEIGSNRLKDDEHFILQAVKYNGGVLKYASNRLKDNEEIVFEAVQKNNVLMWASPRLRDNELIGLEAVKRDGDALQYVSERLRANEQFVLEAVKYHSYASVSDRFKGLGGALRFASDIFKDNEIIVLEAAKQNGYALYNASKRLRNDFNFAKELFKYCNLDVFSGFGEKLRNIEFIYYYIENHQSHFHELMAEYSLHKIREARIMKY